LEGAPALHTISHTATLKETISLMATHRVSVLSVVDDHKAVLGQVQAADLLEN
jgi:CBS-domain-containing membrane protein